MNGRLFAVCCILLITACLWASVPSAAHAKTQLMSGGIQDVDPQTLKELLSTFEQAVETISGRRRIWAKLLVSAAHDQNRDAPRPSHGRSRRARLAALCRRLAASVGRTLRRQ